ncbi:MAG: YdeI/OmpD-associated family protein [Actinomycetes bacterium]
MLTEDAETLVESAKLWPREMAAMRPILLGTGLDESVKWRQPCYSDHGKNIVIMGEMKAGLTLGFFKGALLDDPNRLLVDNGPNSRSVKRMFFTSVADVTASSRTVAHFVEQAIRLERSGASIGPAPALELAPEFQERLDADPALKAAFEALTPGRRREYQLFVSAAKQSATRSARVEKHVERILSGRGLRDR